jgi:uncharacterized RDD family membrane protein YckC
MGNKPPRSRYARQEARIDNWQVSRPASRGRRFAGVVIDQALVFSTFGLLTKSTLWGNWDLDSGASPWQPHFDHAYLGFVIFWGMQGYLLFTRNQTIGKWLLNMRITRPDGSHVSGIRILARYGLSLMASLVPVWSLLINCLVDPVFIFGASRRCLHDEIADTVVLEIRRPA